MAMTIEGIKIQNLTIMRDDKDGTLLLNGSYALMSNNGVVLAKQSFGNGYNDVKVERSFETSEALNRLVASVAADVNKILGF